MPQSASLPASEVIAHLRRRLPEFEPIGSPQRLEGGNLNFVWRVTGQSGSLILKAAPPYIASAPDTAFDPARILFEAEGLKLFGPGRLLADLNSDSIRPPACIDIDPKHHILIMADAGQLPHLGMTLLQDGGRNDWGRVLGEFIGRLHQSTLHSTELAARFNNAAVQETRLAMQYKNLAAFFQRAGIQAPAEVSACAVDIGKRLLKPGRCLTMGDLWPASILIDENILRLIDWEFIHYGNPAQDIGHLAAHLWMHAECASSPALNAQIHAFSRAFLRQYAATVSAHATELLDHQTRQDCAIHFGAEILMRTLGPFAHGYLYDGLALGDRRIQHAVAVAIRSILAGEHPIFAPLAPKHARE